ncbi:hypothetical protein ISCGN_011634 [Ixodes scapularis]
MPKYCAAEGCGNSVVRCETSAHTFPKDEKLCYLWSRLARPSFPTWVPSKSDRLCSEHFRDEDYIRSPSALRPEKEAPSLVHERKFIVFESCLDQLLETCRSCAAPNTYIDKTVQGSSLQVSTLCRSGHTETWCSQPVIRRKPVGNILVAAAILFTGCSIKKALRMLSSMGIACFCYKTFFIIQKAFLLPAIEKVYCYMKTFLIW